MKDRRLEEKPACAVKSAPLPSEVICPHCGIDIEIWSDESDISCKLCGSIVHGQLIHFIRSIELPAGSGQLEIMWLGSVQYIESDYLSVLN